jgi:hypothetical protein
MIINFKIFEKLNDGNPKIGDYVLLNINWYYNDKKFDYFLNNTIGQISKIEKENNKNYIPNINNKYQILFDTTEKFKLLQHNRIKVYDKQIKYFSSNKEELEVILNSNKYNL